MTGETKRRRQRIGALSSSLIALSALTACTAEPVQMPASPSPTLSVPVTAFGEPEVVADGLDAPWSIAFHGETPLLSERDTARILELRIDGSTREIATIAGVNSIGEGGLLGIAVHSGYLYSYFTGSGGNRIERYQLTGGPGALVLGPAETVLAGISSASYHNGGRIAFGPEGMLYATVGDAGNRDDAQNLNLPSGKILRMTPSGAVPEDNPFPGSLVYSYGHRNPQGIAEEAGFIDPVQQWEPADASPSGIAIYNETIYIANLRGQRLREVPVSDPSTAADQFVGEYGRLRDAAVAPDGSLWILTNNTDGRGDPSPDDDRILRVPLT